MKDESIAWLRGQIEADLAAANIISDGGFCRSTGRPSRRARSTLTSIRPAVPCHRRCAWILRKSPCGWVALYAWTRLNGEPPEADSREWDAPVALTDSGRRQFDHICRNDPRNTVADCEAKLAILAEHRVVTSDDEEYSVGAGKTGCATCHYYTQMHVLGKGAPCLTVRLLASAYRHRPGYSEHWAPASS